MLTASMDNTHYSMDTRIRKVLSRLEEQSNRERLEETDILQEDRILAITSDTGMFFKIILRAMLAKRILEVGTSVGYSTLWFANAIIENYDMISTRIKEKPIITIDMNHSKVERANKNFGDAGVKDIIEIIEGDAKSVLFQLSKNYQNDNRIKKLNDLFDFVFFDADKENLEIYFDLVLPMVRVGGIIATDNMLYPEDYQLRMAKYANYIKSKSNVQSVMIPIGNGEEITIKLA